MCKATEQIMMFNSIYRSIHKFLSHLVPDYKEAESWMANAL